MSRGKVTKEMLTSAQFKTYDSNSKVIKYLRENPVIAAEKLLGVSLLDYQAFVLQKIWTSQFSILCMSRNASKSFLFAVAIMLEMLLYENRKIYIVAPIGSQAKETFMTLQRLATNEFDGLEGLSDIFYNEIERANDTISGFSHDPSGYKVKLLNGSFVQTLNGIPSNARSKRANSVYFDETGWLSAEMISVAEAFATTNSSFSTSVDEFFDPRANYERKPNRLVYASSASDKTTDFYQKYQMYSKRMWAGDSRYFAIDIKVDIPLAPTKKGKSYTPLLDRSKPEQALASNAVKAMREYWNSFEETSENQIISAHLIERASTFPLPELTHRKGAKYGIFWDSARVADNSVILIVEFLYDDRIGWHGKAINMVNFKDLSQIKGNSQMLYPEQIKQIRNYLVRYNGNNPDYENIMVFGVDIGMGGGGILYLDELLFDFTDDMGVPHVGVIDKEYQSRETQNKFPNAYNCARMIEPTKNKNMMFESMISMFELGLVQIPYEYSNSGHVDIEVDKDGKETEIYRHRLTKEEELALINFDIAKSEIKMIHRYVTQHGNTVYKLRTDMQGKMHDDRAYVFAMFCSFLRELRDKDKIGKNSSSKSKDRTVLKLFN